MRFALTDEQQGFSASLADLLVASDTADVTRSWGHGDPGPGMALWNRLADQGLHALVVPEALGGLGATPVDLCVAFEQLGRHVVPGPWVESVAYLPVLLEQAQPEVVTELAQGAMGSVRVVEHAPAAVDGRLAAFLYEVEGGRVRVASPGADRESVDRSRLLVEVIPGTDLPVAPERADRAFDHAALACSAMLVGLAEQLLTMTVTYLGQRRQFGREIGSYQALKHMAADIRIALDFTRPLVLGAAVGLGLPTASRDVSAAKVSASSAALRAARTALQLHGAIGYTEEYDLSLWILRVRALAGAWGTPAFHRNRIAGALARGEIW